MLGGGSNLVVADDGFDGTVLQVATRGVAVAPLAEHALQVEAGVDWDHVVALAVDEGYAGIEALSGIPGRVGAAPIQNVGAYGQEVAQTVGWVRVLDRTTHDVVLLDPCGVRLRLPGQRVQARPDRYVVLGRRVRPRALPARRAGPLRRAGARTSASRSATRCPAADVRAAVLDLRRAQGHGARPGRPRHVERRARSSPTRCSTAARGGPAARPTRRAGRSRDGRVKTSAAWLIEQAGFAKGYGTGPARISTKHTLALTNRGGATTEDLLALAREIRDGVRARFGVDLVNEPVLVGDSL